MKAISQEEQELLKELALLEAEYINLVFETCDERAGLLAFNDAVYLYIKFLKSHTREFISGMNLQYRFSIVELLSKIDKKYSGAVCYSLFKNKVK